MKKLIRSKIFISGFFLSYFSFFVVTVFILDLKKDGVGAEHRLLTQSCKRDACAPVETL